MLISHEDTPRVSQACMNDTHKEEVELITTVFEQIPGYDGSEESAKIINDLYTSWVEYTVDHFQKKESKMQEIYFPPYLAYKGGT